jgi:hypothetical protein
MVYKGTKAIEEMNSRQGTKKQANFAKKNLNSISKREELKTLKCFSTSYISRIQFQKRNNLKPSSTFSRSRISTYNETWGDHKS